MVVRLGEGLADVAAVEARVERLAGFAHGLRVALGVVDLAGERHQHAQRVALAFDVFADGFLPAHGFEPRAHHHHGLGAALEQRLHVLAVVLHHHLHLGSDVVGVQAHPLHHALHGGAALDLHVVEALPVMGEAKRKVVARVVLQHIEDETLLDRLPHRIHVKGLRQPVRACAAEQLQRLGLRGGGERNVGQARGRATRFHLRGQHGLGVDTAPVQHFGPFLRAQHLLELRRRLPGLRAVRLVGDHCEALALRRGQLAHGLQREGEGLDGADDDLLAGLQRLAQLLALGSALVRDRGHHAGIALEVEDRLAQLRVKHVAVGHHQHAVEHLLLVRIVQVGQEVR